jgi:pimeloyl-ACP methyl ester carboxylesterase
LNIRKVNMEVGLDPEDEENMEKHIFASGMLQNIGPVDISKRLFKKLRDCDNAKKGLLRVHDFGYDWRLSPHLLSRKIVEFLEKLPSNQPGVQVEKRGALVIAHSLGGMLTRHAVNQRPELFSGVLYAGVPQRCINILGPLRNGDAVLLNEKVLTARVNFSLRTTFVFLPEDGFCFVDKHTGESYPVDFYNVDDWIKYRLSPCVSDPALPPLSLKGSTSFGRPLRSLSGSFPTLPLRGRSDSDGKKHHSPPRHSAQETLRKAEITKDRTLAPQMLSSSGSPNDVQQQIASTPTTPSDRARNIAYLRRTLDQTKTFRAELAHNPSHQAANIYPPIAVLYGKEIPTVYAARVNAGGIPHADAYDDLAFHSGDGVVLAREAMPPAGYEIAKDGRVSSDRGHITLLGDLSAVGRALQAIVRGRRKGIGMGSGAES